MDTEPLAPRTLQSVFRFLWFANHWFGGWRVVRETFARWSRGWTSGQTLTVLDVGAGDADLSVTLVLWGRKKGFRIRVVALEKVPEIAQLARQKARKYPEIELWEADFFDLPHGSTFDYVIGSLFLHHVPGEHHVGALQRFDRLARRGILVSDLERLALAYWGVTLTTWLLGNRIVRHDGPVSVRRSFTLQELEALARQASLSYLCARKHPFFRLSLSGEKYDFR